MFSQAFASWGGMLAAVRQCFLLTACLACLFTALADAQRSHPDPFAWAQVTKENMPGTRWWWMGSAVNPGDLARELKAYREAGLGTVEIVPIYGARGYENQCVDYLGPKWMELLKKTLSEATKLGMDVDMVTGSGWCFGGPGVSDQDANALAVYGNGAVSQKPSGQKVKRSGPDWQGWMLNPLFPDSMTRYLERFSKAFAGYDGPRPHAQTHDSYEYNSNWAPDFPEQFERRRGYSLQEELPALFEGRGEPEHVARVKDDYRETAYDLIHESISRWTQWSHDHGFLSRNQAHGSPGNWLDIYAASDMPETEINFYKGGANILISKFASSAAHVAGKNIVSSETGTWSAEHFTETLSALKSLCDHFFLAGVNRIMWHGTASSPADAPWPGWCFYASTEMNPRNAIWRDAPALHAYLTRVQGMMQSGRPDNDVLLYWPIHDLWHDPKGLLKPMTVHRVDWFNKQAFGWTAEMLWKHGCAFDYVSDKLLQGAKAEKGTIRLGDGRYRAVVVPECVHMPLETMKKLESLSREGAAVIFEGSVPRDVPGSHDLEKRRAEMQVLAAKFTSTPDGQLDAALEKSGVRREQALAGHEGLEFTRRAIDGGHVYFIANRGANPLDQPVRLASPLQQAVILDPANGSTGLAQVPDGCVRLQLDPGESLLVRTLEAPAPPDSPLWLYRNPGGPAAELIGRWEVRFTEGGPTLPPPFVTEKLASWSELGGPEAQSFAGAATYALRFNAPADNKAQGWILDLGKVVQSARVRLNGKDLGTLFAPPFRVPIGSLKPHDNLLEVEVTGTSANRIRDLDVRGVKWKIFYDANVLSSKYKPFDASQWTIAEQGLLGPVTLQPQAGPAVSAGH